MGLKVAPLTFTNVAFPGGNPGEASTCEKERQAGPTVAVGTPDASEDRELPLLCGSSSKRK